MKKPGDRTIMTINDTAYGHAGKLLGNNTQNRRSHWKEKNVLIIL